MTTTPTAEFSRPIAVESLEDCGIEISVEADVTECARLAERFGLVAIDRLAGDVRLTPEEGGALIRLDGRFEAEVVQTCVVTLEPLPVRVEESFTRRYSTAAEPDEATEVHLVLDAEEPPDPVEDGCIDVGEAIAEQLALSLDPFPRKPGISFADYSSRAGGGDADSGAKAADSGAAEGPFAALARLRDKLK